MNIKYMNMAFNEAEKAYKEGEVPIGAVIVKDGIIISKAHNMKEKEKCCIKHAEIIAIEEASKIIDNWRLNDCEMYVTLDPCPMCASAIKQSRINTVYSAGPNSDLNNLDIIKTIFSISDINSSINFISNVDVDRSKKILSDFYIKQRLK